MVHIVDHAPAGSFQQASGAGNLAFVTLVSLVSAMGGFLFGYDTVVIAGKLALVKAQ